MAAGVVSFVTFPSGRIFKPASDELKRQLGDTFMDDFEANPFRDYLKTMVYYNTEPNDTTGRMENAYQTLLAVEPLWQRFKKAEHKGSFEGLTFEDFVVEASQNGDISEEEAEVLIHYNALRFDSLLTDTFDEHLEQVHERTNPHSLENAVDKLTNYAQLKKDAQIRNGTYIDKASTTEDHQSPNDQDSADHYQDYQQSEPQTGDNNPNHGYEPDGDVKMVAEQNTTQERRAQADFNKAPTKEEALYYRTRDAEAILNNRMNENHSAAKWQDGLRRDNVNENDSE